MKRRIFPVCVLCLAALVSACSRQGEPATSHGPAGHDDNAPQAVAAASTKPEMCAEHRVEEAECGICRPQLAGTLKPGESAKIRLPGADSAGIAGVEIAPAQTGRIIEPVECYAELIFNQNKLAQIVAPVGGFVREVPVDLGERVVEQQPVARIWSSAIAETLAKAVLSHQNLERERRLHASGISPQRDLQQTEADHRSSCQQLLSLGFSEAQIHELEDRPLEPVLLDVRAPFAGELVERSVVRGALVEGGKTLFTLADTSVLWAMLSIPEAAMARVKVGQTVELRVESLPGRVFAGRLTWIGPEVNAHTRMVRARAEVSNSEGLLKANMFAQARVVVRVAENAVLLPERALQQVEGRPFVFVRRGEDLFDARAVRLGARSDGKAEVLEGLAAREPVAVSHVFALKSTFLLSRLGAGCADD
jgi:RND family efflux transporter MFP subunit